MLIRFEQIMCQSRVKMITELFEMVMPLVEILIRMLIILTCITISRSGLHHHFHHQIRPEADDDDDGDNNTFNTNNNIYILDSASCFLSDEVTDLINLL